MQGKFKIFASFLLVFSLSFVALLLLSPLSVNAQGKPEKPGKPTNSVVCPSGDGWVKFDWKDKDKSQTYDASSGNIVSEVCIKGGTIREFFTQDGTKSCWIVSGIGTQITTAKEDWYKDKKGPECKDISHVSFKVEEKYIECSETITETGEWSEWMSLPKKKYTEYRTRTILYLDARDNSILCDTEVEKETRKKPKYEICSETNEIYGTWSEWQLDPTDPMKEFRTVTVNYFDVKFTKKLCDTKEIIEYRDIVINGNGDTNGDGDTYDEPDVMGEADTAGVKGATTVVLASTAGGEVSIIYLIQSLLLLLTGVSLVYAGREYLNR